MNEELLNKIIDQIDTEKIVPIPRWRFLALRVIFWFLAVFSIILGGFAISVMSFLFSDYHRHGLPSIPKDATELLSLIPYIWLAVFVLFIMIGRESVKHTKKGYQYRLYIIVIFSVFLSFVLGCVLNFVGIGRLTHEFLNQNIPFYNYSTYDSRKAWNRPVIGRLAGVVVSVEDKNNFSVVDFAGHVWRVCLATSTAGLLTPEASSTVRMIGILDPSSNLFIVNSIMEWED